MANETKESRPAPSDAIDNASTNAPDIRNEAEDEHACGSDSRLMPGGAHGASADPGMSSLHEDDLTEDPHKSH